MEVLIRRGADVNAKWDGAAYGDGRWTALHISAVEGRVAAAKLLIRAGADINAKTLRGQTPLDIAIMNRHESLAALFQANGGVSGKER